MINYKENVHTENRFNLIDEKWIPVATKGLFSLKDIFSINESAELGGNSVEKIAIMKLLFAIAQSAYTPEDDQDYKSINADKLAEKCLEYLEKWRDCFYLYGEKPFLQIPAIEKAKIVSFGAISSEIATGNNTVLKETQIEREYTDAEKALVLLCQMNFALGGKKCDNSIVLSKEYNGKTNEKGKPSSAPFGPSLGYLGLLHSFFIEENLKQTIYINLFTKDDIEKEMKIFTDGVGIAPWENMPQGEDDKVAKNLKNSLMGRLIALSRFCLLSDNGLCYSEGIKHSGYKEGMYDLTIAVNNKNKKKEVKVKWVNPNVSSWREIPALLSFLEFDCFQLRLIKNKINNDKKFAIWSGGLRVSSNAGEQYVSSKDDYIESTIWLTKDILNTTAFDFLKLEIEELQQINKKIYNHVNRYSKSLGEDNKNIPANATNLFWQLCNKDSQELIDCCLDRNIEAIKRMRKIFVSYAEQIYNQFCPKETARQIEAWAKNLPNFKNYLNYLTNDRSEK